MIEFDKSTRSAAAAMHHLSEQIEILRKSIFDARVSKIKKEYEEYLTLSKSDCLTLKQWKRRNALSRLIQTVMGDEFESFSRKIKK